MYDLKGISSDEIYQVANVKSVQAINWDEVAKVIMTPRAERTLTPPQCYGQLVMVKDYGFVCRLFSDDENPVALCEEEDGAVCNDSALEFFVKFEESGYLNIETNYKGISHQKFGNPGNRKPVADFFEERFEIKTSKFDLG